MIGVGLTVMTRDGEVVPPLDASSVIAPSVATLAIFIFPTGALLAVFSVGVVFA